MSAAAEWSAAFEAAGLGRRPDGVDPVLFAWAQRVQAARRAQHADETCPTSVRARLQSVFQEHTAKRGAGLLRIVLDSLRDPLPATRGTGTRMLRLQADETTVDMRMRSLEGEVVVEVMAADLPEDTSLARRVLPDTSWDDVALDPDGAGTFRIAQDAPAFHVALRRGGEVVASSEPIAAK